jgi:hypothetical protein
MKWKLYSKKNLKKIQTHAASERRRAAATVWNGLQQAILFDDVQWSAVNAAAGGGYEGTARYV